MSLVSETIPSLINGVSQQPPTLRLPTQVAEQINAFSSEVDGLRKRPPFRFVGNLTGSVPANVFIHGINRDAQEQYIVVIRDGDLQVFDVNGVAQTVNFPDGKAYLDADPLGASEAFRCVTIADNTFVLNRNVEAAMLADLTPTRPKEALVVVKQSAYGRLYRVTIEDEVATYSGSYETPDGGDATDAPFADNEYILGAIHAQLLTGAAVTGGGSMYTYTLINRTGSKFAKGQTVRNSLGGKKGRVNSFNSSTNTLVVNMDTAPFAIGEHIECTSFGGSGEADIDTVTAGAGSVVYPPLTSDYAIEINGSTMTIVRDSGDFSVVTSDGQNGNGMSVYKGAVQRLSALPSLAAEGFELSVLGEEGSVFDNYYVRFAKETPTDSTGVWRECVAQGVQYRLDPATMPHLLVREADNTFTFKRATWADRTVGDDTSAPAPSFVGRTLNDLFLHRNRLGILADENVVLTESGEYFNFFPTTVTVEQDAAPIDVTVSTNIVAILRAAVPFEKELILFSEKAQLALSGGAVLSARSATLDPVTYFDYSVKAPPAAIGKSIYFASERGGATAVQEFRATEDGLRFDATEANAHCPTYVPGGLYRFTACPQRNLLAALTEEAPYRIYVHKFYWNGGQKVQASWSRWDLPSTHTILGAEFMGTTLYVVAREGTETRLLAADFSHASPVAPETFHVHLDQLVSDASTGVSRALNPTGTGGYTVSTRITLPWVPPADTQVVTRPEVGNEDAFEGQALNVFAVGANYVDVEGDFTELPVYIGIPYTMRVRLSTIYTVRGDRSGNAAAVIGGRLQLRRMRMNYANTGAFRVEVTPVRRDTRTYVLTAQNLGDPEFTLGAAPIDSAGSFSWPVQCRNTDVVIELVSDYFTPCVLQALEWDGFYTNNTIESRR